MDEKDFLYTKTFLLNQYKCLLKSYEHLLWELLLLSSRTFLIYQNFQKPLQYNFCLAYYSHHQSEFQKLSPKDAKKLGRRIELRDDWDLIKDNIMYNILCHKFKDNFSLKKALLDTNDIYLVEGNNWGDVYWGVCKNIGYNKLGEILMKIREEIKNEN